MSKETIKKLVKASNAFTSQKSVHCNEHKQIKSHKKG